MNYPVWELPMGGGVLIAVVSILHVFVSHFAVGGGLWLVWTEMRAHRSGDERLRDYVKHHSRFFLLLTLVFGAISGVGIWVTIALVSPQATSTLVHAYVWGWAMEWVFFFVEIGAALVYYYGWERLDRGTHELVGWIYFVAAFMSLVIINGIITFMLTPGGWLEDRQFWTGFFNPTYFPSLAIRTFGSLGIAGIFTLLTASWLERGTFRTRLVRWNSLWVLVPLLGVAASAAWYRGQVPVWDEALLGAIPVLPLVARLFAWGLALTALLAVAALVLPRQWGRAPAVLLLVAGLAAMGAGEWMREAGRKPFTIHGYLYSTGLRVDQQDDFSAAGMAAGTRWLSPAGATDPVRRGRDLYLAWCQPCHTDSGYNGLKPYLAYWDEQTIASLVPRLEHMRALMPPWYGTDDENAALTAYLMTRRPAEPAVLPDDPVSGGRVAFAVSCGLCHTAHGFRSVAEFFEGMDAAEVDEFLDEAGDMVDEMPAYYGTGRTRDLLVAHLTALGAGDEGSQP
jgi:mono/diheme cytochrome c family protein